MSVQNDTQALWSQDETHSGEQAFQSSDFVLIEEGKPPSRIELARERMLISRLYLGLLRTIMDDYGTEFAAQSDSLTYRTIAFTSFCVLSCVRLSVQVKSRTRSNCRARRC
jgi:hypothetical protein